MGFETLHRLGASRLGVWAIKHLVAPLDRRIFRWSGGRVTATGRLMGPVLLLTTTVRRTGIARTTPVFYHRDGDLLVVCNVNPGFEHPNPWPLNPRATQVARVQIGPEVATYRAREATAAEVERYWPQPVQRWPAYQSHYTRSGERSIFVRECAPDEDSADCQEHERAARDEPDGPTTS